MQRAFALHEVVRSLLMLADAETFKSLELEQLIVFDGKVSSQRKGTSRFLYTYPSALTVHVLEEFWSILLTDTETFPRVFNWVSVTVIVARSPSYTD